ncbi:hypothetical protein HXX76_007091 [Chlamydomonas incerta]|uniref:Uncharacterized protein n=1 Tax=Chlamydomonas incerta TaxID=51695 RepID=A0A835W4V9_CHLIN|nr:hypothetical protein HXX76_007091 [Chlamydomonas incerta]|eukprot:KAG2435896.1 hypothetical protein HXX76_007091 [Chlamydomonas incerta]
MTPSIQSSMGAIKQNNDDFNKNLNAWSGRVDVDLLATSQLSNKHELQLNDIRSLIAIARDLLDKTNVAIKQAQNDLKQKTNDLETALKNAADNGKEAVEAVLKRVKKVEDDTKVMQDNAEKMGDSIKGHKNSIEEASTKWEQGQEDDRKARVELEGKIADGMREVEAHADEESADALASAIAEKEKLDAKLVSAIEDTNGKFANVDAKFEGFDKDVKDLEEQRRVVAGALDGLVLAVPVKLTGAKADFAAEAQLKVNAMKQAVEGKIAKAQEDDRAAWNDEIQRALEGERSGWTGEMASFAAKLNIEGLRQAVVESNGKAAKALEKADALAQSTGAI